MACPAVPHAGRPALDRRRVVRRAHAERQWRAGRERCSISIKPGAGEGGPRQSAALGLAIRKPGKRPNLVRRQIGGNFTKNQKWRHPVGTRWTTKEEARHWR